MATREEMPDITNSLEVLTSLTTTFWASIDKDKTERLIRTVRPANAEDTPDWFLSVPHFYNTALDIQLLPRVFKDQETGEKTTKHVWTQGIWLDFHKGDTFYDSKQPLSDWSETLQKTGLIVQVDDAASVGLNPAHFEGRVTFSIHSPNLSKTKVVKRFLYTCTQFEFVRFLIEGPGEELTKLFVEHGI